MRSIKFSAAAVLLVAGVILLQSKLTAKAFAIEETARAIGTLSSLYVSGVHISEDGHASDIKIWTRVHSQDSSRSGDFREEVNDTRLSVVSEKENTTWRYFPQKNTVEIMSGLQNSVKPFWPDGSFFLDLRANARQWSQVEGYDADGRPCVMVTCTYELERLPGRRFEFWIRFDTQTMLPTQLKIRDFAQSRSPQEYSFDTIRFNQPLPDDLFTFQIPQDAAVADLR